jgi:hypothetical protein
MSDGRGYFNTAYNSPLLNTSRAARSACAHAQFGCDSDLLTLT